MVATTSERRAAPVQSSYDSTGPAADPGGAERRATILNVMDWDPLHELVALRDRSSRRPSQPDGAWTPNVDLLETEAAFVLVAELPGLKDGDLEITATSDGLVLAGQRRVLAPPAQRFLRMERGHGRFSRAFAFGEPIDVSGIKAHFDRGLLTITVPKAAPAPDRRITIG
jgi:HSP20 family protein